jgi:2-(1,2-epoxy-1,2-dihydrophenyl)acetyl-CoA isomerase
MSDMVRVAVAGGAMRVTLERPERLNALCAEMLDALTDAFLQARDDDAVRVVVLRASGRAFCAGQDLGEADVAAGYDLGAHVERHYTPLVRAMRELPKPIVAGVQGVAAGAGANLALACDIVVAARSARFIESFSRIGLLPDTGGTWMLPRLVGHARAVALALLAEPMTAEQAQAWGAIWSVADDDALDARCEEIVASLASAPTKALGATKAAMAAAWSNDLGAQLDAEREGQRELGRTHDFVEGVTAFAQKRAPVFRGK